MDYFQRGLRWCVATMALGVMSVCLFLLPLPSPMRWASMGSAIIVGVAEVGCFIQMIYCYWRHLQEMSDK